MMEEEAVMRGCCLVVVVASPRSCCCCCPPPCAVPCDWLDGKHVVFGRVTKGEDIVKAVEACGTRSGATAKTIRITDSGQLA